MINIQIKTDGMYIPKKRKLTSWEKILEHTGEKHENYLNFINQWIFCPQRYLDAYPGQLDEKLIRFLENDFIGAYLYGDVGTGKTHALYAIAKLIKASAMDVRIKNIPEWLDHIRSFYSDEYRDQMMDEINYNGVLLLDDFGAEKTSEWTIEMLYRIINKRYEQGFVTIFASNLNLKEMAGIYGDRIVSRIVEMVGKEHIIKLTGDDRRIS